MAGKKRDQVRLDVPRESLAYRVVIDPGDPVTTCEVLYQTYPLIDEPGYWTEMAYGIGVRKESDWYDREIGCRMALKSALRKIPGKDLRRVMWAKFLEAFPVSERTEALGEAFVQRFVTEVVGGAYEPSFVKMLREVL